MWKPTVVALGLSLLLAGCGDEEYGCDEVEGLFGTFYEHVGPTMSGLPPCGPLPTGGHPHLDIPMGAGANRTAEQTGAGRQRTSTSVNVSGCTLRYTQETFVGQVRRWKIGGDLDVIASDELEGSAYRIMYDEQDRPICESNYHVTLSQGWAAGN